MITVIFNDRPQEVFNTSSYAADGSFIQIVEQIRGVTQITCLPVHLIERIIIQQR